MGGGGKGGGMKLQSMTNVILLESSAVIPSVKVVMMFPSE